MKTISLLLGILLSVCLVVILLVCSIQIPAFSPSFYRREFAKNGVYDDVMMAEADVMAVTEHMIGYLKNRHDALNTETVVNGEKRLFFSEREISHMEDVRRLLVTADGVKNAAVMLFAVAFVILTLTKMKAVFLLLKCVRNACAAAFGLSAALAVTVALGFDRAFTAFHGVFFDNDLWILDPREDLLINILPQQFFTDISVYIALLFAAVLSVVFTASNVALHLHKRYVLCQG